MVQQTKMKRIPLTYIVRAQSLYVRIFGFEDSDGIPLDEIHEYGACKREYDAYLDKMFGDDVEAMGKLDHMFNSTMLSPGTFKPICDMLRSIGYEVLSADNASREEIAACKKELLAKWKERRAAK